MKTQLFYNKENNFDEEVFSSIKTEFTSKEIGYYSLPIDQKAQILEILEVCKAKNLQNVVVVGIGGSSLGAKAIHRLLKHQKTSPTKLLFLENSDPIELHQITKDLDLSNTNFIITSKSGSTIETTSIFKYIISLYGKLESDKFFIITDKGSNLDKFAQKNGIKSFYIYPNVGGRFSVLSVVGLLPLALAGYDIQEILEGAKEISDNFFSQKEDYNLLAKANFLAKSPQSITVVFAYGSEFDEFVKWFVQLWGESLGKINQNGDFVGLTPIGVIGAVDQHSFLQLIMEGPRDKIVSFIKVQNFGSSLAVPDISLEFLESTNYINGKKFSELINAQCEATQEALNSVGINTDLIEIDSISCKNVGKIIYYFELLTSLVGTNLKINTYNQPGVELGKKILEKKFN